MKINSKEISSLIKEQIKHYSKSVDSSDVGTVISVGDGIALVYGLTAAMLGELLLFPNDIYGLVMNLESDHVGVVLLGDDRLIKEGDEVIIGSVGGKAGKTAPAKRRGGPPGMF